MGGRAGQIRWGARSLSAAGVVLLVTGAALGWLAPRLAGAAAPYVDTAARLAGSGLDASGYLGADITALAVIIAVVIGFNATTLQIAGQTHSLALVRAILRSLTPFLACWSLTTGVALAYFLLPPVYVAQLWQMLCWFGAVVLLMVAYLWDLPWRLSGEYVGLWAIRGLSGHPLDRWESLDGFSALQTSVASASVRGDLGTVRSITSVLGGFLVGVRDPRAEEAQVYDRGRYRALKNLLSGCAQNIAQAPNAVAYNLGFVLAGVLLQAVAVGHLMDDADHDLFSGLLGAARAAPERLNPLWTGMRHALCRGSSHDDPYLLRFWLLRGRWSLDDPRRATHVADGMGWLYASCWRELRTAWDAPSANVEASQMVIDLYRDIAVHLGKRIAHERRRAGNAPLRDLPLAVLDKTHAVVMRGWPNGSAEAERVAVVNAYETRRTELIALLGS
jgi:hypothetical protein